MSIHTYICLGLVVVLIMVLTCQSAEGFTNMEKIADLVENKSLFEPSSTYDTAKSRVEWMDPITYYDAVELFRSDKFTPRHLSDVL